jgi:hypothetical protein
MRDDLAERLTVDDATPVRRFVRAVGADIRILSQ